MRSNALSQETSPREWQHIGDFPSLRWRNLRTELHSCGQGTICWGKEPSRQDRTGPFQALGICDVLFAYDGCLSRVLGGSTDEVERGGPAEKGHLRDGPQDSNYLHR